MASKSSIEWTDATWNPIVGCDIVSPGCTNCYAMKVAARIERCFADTDKAPQYRRLTKQTKAGPVWTGKVLAAPKSILDQPLRWKRPRRIFVNSMGDLFHEGIQISLIDHVVAVMYLAPQHIYQVLTKRPEGMRRYWSDPDLPARIARLVAWIAGEKVVDAVERNIREHHFPNVWLGVSVERQQEADERIPLLLQTPAAVRFISAEPLLGPIDLSRINTCVPPDFSLTEGANLDLVIVGAESGPKARPMHPQWARALRDQCAVAGVPFFFKQWGEYLPVGQSLPGYGKVHGATTVKPGRMKLHCGVTPDHSPKHAFAKRGVKFASTADGLLTFRVGKKRAGRLLDGKEHNEFPAIRDETEAA